MIRKPRKYRILNKPGYNYEGATRNQLRFSAAALYSMAKAGGRSARDRGDHQAAWNLRQTERVTRIKLFGIPMPKTQTFSWRRRDL